MLKICCMVSKMLLFKDSVPVFRLIRIIIDENVCIFVSIQ